MHNQQSDVSFLRSQNYCPLVWTGEYPHTQTHVLSDCQNTNQEAWYQEHMLCVDARLTISSPYRSISHINSGLFATREVTLHVPKASFGLGALSSQ